MKNINPTDSSIPDVSGELLGKGAFGNIYKISSSEQVIKIPRKDNILRLS